MGDSYVTATHPALNSVCCYTFGGKPPCLKKKSEESGSEADVRGNRGPSSIQAASPSVSTKKRARKATA